MTGQYRRFDLARNPLPREPPEDLVVERGRILKLRRVPRAVEDVHREVAERAAEVVPRCVGDREVETTMVSSWWSWSLMWMETFRSS